MYPVKCKSKELCLKTRRERFLEDIEDPLLRMVKMFIDKYVAIVPDDLDIVARYVLYTYQDHADRERVPVLVVYGDNGSGKTRLLETVAPLCWCSFVASPALPLSVLCNELETRESYTLLIDEFSLISDPDRRYTKESVFAARGRHPAIITQHDRYSCVVPAYTYNIFMYPSDDRPRFLGPDFHSEAQEIHNLIARRR